ncbi:MAG: NAD(P)/FAD-dependent oxidoreductase [Archaeoglobaceae archaeon]|nr:NAD(P)/FAD-dependent oxidoreductase [Archaeoglobaceae archaeon]MDW8118606.1 NAD(P)/FAD-dependent oxidoreductase [Archaeoglobaceae archaeon]
MIQIYGAGMAGTYLYSLLTKNGIKANIFDLRKTPDCRCAWGFAYSEAKELYSKIEVNLDDYVLVRPKNIVVNRLQLKNRDVVIVNKLKLLEDLWKSIEFRESDAEIVVDATGAKRAFLPKIEKDRFIYTIQFIEEHEREEDIFINFERHGYAWAFPLGGEWHIGAGSAYEEKVEKLIQKLRERYDFREKEKKCNCKAELRMLPPSKCRPFVHGKVVGVGEAIGCVSGAGEGNVPALKSALILFECLNKLEMYEKRIMKEFSWIEREQRFVDSALKGLPAFHLLPKIIAFERKRLVEHSLIDFLRIFI